MGSMADKGLKSHPYGFGIRCGTAHGAGLLEELFVNVERLLHTDDRAISCHPKQPDRPTGVGCARTLAREVLITLMLKLRVGHVALDLLYFCIGSLLIFFEHEDILVGSDQLCLTAFDLGRA